MEDFAMHAVNYPRNTSDYEKYMIWKKMTEIESEPTAGSPQKSIEERDQILISLGAEVGVISQNKYRQNMNKQRTLE